MGNEVLKKRFSEKYYEWKTMIEVGLLKTGDHSPHIKRLTNAIILILDGIIFMRVAGNIPVIIDDACSLLIKLNE